MTSEMTVDGIALIEGQDAEVTPRFRPITTAPETVMLKGQDGDCPAYLFRPAGSGPWPAALFLMDGFGMRANLIEMAQRLSDGGYLVLLPDLFYRRGTYEPLDVGAIFAGGNLRQDVFDALGMSPTVPMVTADAAAFLDFLTTHPDAAGNKVGVTGYCMSGGMALAIAGTYPNAVAAAACFHGGLLVTDADASPHRLVPSITADIYVGGAQTDEWCPPEMVAILDRAMADAAVTHRCEIYKGTLHGWTMRDSPLYNAPAAERHWHELFALFRRAI